MSFWTTSQKQLYLWSSNIDTHDDPEAPWSRIDFSPRVKGQGYTDRKYLNTCCIALYRRSLDGWTTRRDSYQTSVLSIYLLTYLLTTKAYCGWAWIPLCDVTAYLENAEKLF